MPTPSGEAWGYVCVDCQKKSGSLLTLPVARRRCADHARRTRGTHHIFILRNGLTTLEVWGGYAST